MGFRGGWQVRLGEQLPVRNKQTAQAFPEEAAWVEGYARVEGFLRGWEEVPWHDRRCP